MNVLLMLAHSIEEYDQLRLMHDLGHSVSSIGGYINPSDPHDDKRPALPDVPMVQVVKDAVDALGQQGHTDTLTAAKRRLPEAIIEWADVIICHHLEGQWLAPQWPRIRHKRVVWRTVGQSGDANELTMRPLRDDGLQVVRYSPREENIPNYVGADALIRFYKDPDEWTGWTGERNLVTNITQSLLRRSLANDGMLQPPGKQWTSFSFWFEATQGLDALAAGPESEAIGGVGALPYDRMQEWLRSCRAYLYTGTQPASYTLGLIEAMMTGVPVVSIGPDWFRILPYGPELFEGHEIAGQWSNDPKVAHDLLQLLLLDEEAASVASAWTRGRAIELFGKEQIGRQWQEFLTGVPAKPELVTA